MCYSIYKSFKLTNDKIVYVCGDNNIVPHIFTKYEEERTEKNIKNLIKGILEGYVQPYRSIKLGEFADRIRQEKDRYNTVSNFCKDAECKMNRYEEFINLFIDVIAYDYFWYFFAKIGFDNRKNNAAVKQLIYFENESLELYEKEENKQRESGIVPISCAICSHIFPEHDILIDKNQRLIIAKQANYESGHLNNSDNSAIFLDGVESSSRNLYFLYDGANFTNVEDSTFKRIEEILLEKNTGLYNQFHVLTLAKQNC